ncbi:MAG TPA: serine hydrolase domain-containing protein [Pirellulales bacterium]|jgi:CubicO group peptidase (beta-lactamase class C family)|nr:serine hydrolase domain-containing protein [Pirellulales bacterium]
MIPGSPIPVQGLRELVSKQLDAKPPQTLYSNEGIPMIARSLVVVAGLGFVVGASAAWADDPKPTAKETADVAGVWHSDWGLVTLQTAPVEGKKLRSVTGYYFTDKDHTGLIKSGSFDPSTGELEFALEEPWWEDDTKGTVKLTLATDGKGLKGPYTKVNKNGGRDEGVVSMTRGRGQSWKPVDIAGLWDSGWGYITLRTAPIKGKKLLSVTGSYISNTGKDRKGFIAGAFDPALGVLEFSLKEPWWGNDTKGTALLTVGADGNRFQGIYLKVNKDGGRDEGVQTILRIRGSDFATRLDSIIADAGIKGDTTPGAAVLVVERGKIVLQKCFGLANIKEKRPITPQTTFELCSCSKQFTGAAVLRLYEQGKLKLDDDIRKYLPEMPEYDKNNPIRISHLARHTSGLPDFQPFPNVKSKDPAFLTNEDFAGEFARQQKQFPLLFPTGKDFRYTNTNYMLLALVVTRVSKESLGTFMTDEFFDPLGMKTAKVNENHSVMPWQPATGYHRANGTFQSAYGPAAVTHEKLLPVGHAGVWASLEDLVRWDAGWRQGKVIQAATQREVLVPSAYGDGQTSNYAFGWWVTVEKDRLLNIRHDGSCGGFLTYVERYAVQDRTLIVLSNVDSLDVDAVIRLFEATPRLGK